MEKWSESDSIKQMSIMKIEKKLQEKHHLPRNREPITLVNRELPPNRILLQPVIRLGLIDDVSKTNTDPVQLYNIGIKTIMSYPESINQVYTDGSAFKGTYRAGYGARIEFYDKTCKEFAEPCGTHCDNFEAEAEAIQHVIQKLNETFINNPDKVSDSVIFTDSLSVLQTLDQQNYTSKSIRNLALQISSFLEKHPSTVYLQWIPSHCGIEGNERADTLAKRGASMIQPERCVSQGTAKQILKSNRTIEWHNSWARSDKGRILFNYMPVPNKKDPINTLPRKDQVAIFRLRTNHIQLNAHLSRILKDHNPACPLCDYKEESVQHFLFDCPLLQDIRSKFLPLNPTRENTLYSPKPQLLKTSSFYHEAMNRRIKIQV